MKVLNVHEAKTHLSRALEMVIGGEEIVIARNGKPVARLIPFEAEDRKPGRLKGQITIHDDFDAPLPEELESAFRGENP